MAFNTTEIENLIDAHMDNQPYSIECNDCGNKLDVASSSYDHEKDLNLVVTACQTCVENAKEEGREEGRNE